MPDLVRIKLPSPIRLGISSTSGKSALMVLIVLILAPLAAHAQGSPFDTGFNASKVFSPAPLRRLQVWLQL